MNYANPISRETLGGKAVYAYCTAKSEEEAQKCENYEKYGGNHTNGCKHWAWLSGLCEKYYQNAEGRKKK